MFCSTECVNESSQRYHQYECPIIDQLLQSGSVHMALRLFFIALSIFDGSIENLEECVKCNHNSNATLFDVDFKSQVNEKDKSLFMALVALVKSSKTFLLHHHEKILKNHPQLKDFWQNHESFIKNFLQCQCQTSDHNFHGIFSGSSRKLVDQSSSKVISNLQQSVGSGSLLFGSLINHSCSNNILRVCFEGKVIFVVCRPIDKGSQIFDCYK